MQRASLSALRSCIGGTAQLEASLQRAFFSSLTSSSVSGASPVLPSPAVRSSAPASPSGLGLRNAFALKGVRFAGDYKPAVPGNTIDNWGELRASSNKDKPSSFGGNYYLNVLAMGFAYWLNEAYYFPPRTLYMGAFVFFVLYVRKAFFSTPLAFKHDY